MQEALAHGSVANSCHAERGHSLLGPGCVDSRADGFTSDDRER